SDNVHLVWYNVTSPAIIHYRERTSGGWQTQSDLTSGAVNDVGPNLIWALHPTVNGLKPNRPKTGYAMAWQSNELVNRDKYYPSADLTWDSAAAAGPCTPAVSKLTGVWSSTNTWDTGFVPSSCTVVNIAGGTTVTVDITTATVSTMTVSG